MPLLNQVPATGARSVDLVLAESVVLGDLLALDASSEGVKAESTFSAGKFFIFGVAEEAGSPAATISVATLHGILVPVRFGAAPLTASNGQLVYLSATPGAATLLVPSAGNVIYTIGILVGADGVNTTPNVLTQPRYVSRIP